MSRKSVDPPCTARTSWTSGCLPTPDPGKQCETNLGGSASFRSVASGRQRKLRCPSVQMAATSATYIWALPLLEIARVLVCLDHVASFIVNANHRIVGTAPKPRQSNNGAGGHRPP